MTSETAKPSTRKPRQPRQAAAAPRKAAKPAAKKRNTRKPPADAIAAIDANLAAGVSQAPSAAPKQPRAKKPRKPIAKTPRAPRLDFDAIMAVAASLKPDDTQIFKSIRRQLELAPKASRSRIVVALGKMFG